MDIKGFENDTILRRFLDIYLDNNVMQHIFGSKILFIFFATYKWNILNISLKYFKISSHLSSYSGCTLGSLFCEYIKKISNLILKNGFDVSFDSKK